MAYKVIKKIKGHFYVYEQETYRQGGKVRTLNRYIGPVKKAIKGVSGKVLEKSTERKIIDNRIDLKPYSISEPAIKKISEEFIGHLESMGIDTQAIPKIKFQHGPKVGYKKAFSGAYVVYLPRYSTGKRSKFHKAFGRALTMAGLELIRNQQPVIYDQIQQCFDESYRRTQWMLWQYILNTNDYKKLFKALGLIVFRVYNPIYKSQIPAENLGLTDFERKTWEDEMGDLITQVMKQGYKKTLREWNKNRFKARASEKKAIEVYREQKQKMGIIKKMGGWMKKWRQNMKRAIARRQAHEEIYRRLVVIKEVFKF